MDHSISLNKSADFYFVAKRKVIFYSSPACQWCGKTKEFFKRNKILFEERDVTKNAKYIHEVLAKTKQMGIPVTEIDGKIIVGFDEEKLKTAFGVG